MSRRDRNGGREHRDLCENPDDEKGGQKGQWRDGGQRLCILWLGKVRAGGSLLVGTSRWRRDEVK